MPYKNIEDKRAHERKYSKTPKGREINRKAKKKYNHSQKGRDRERAYRKTPKGIEGQRRSYFKNNYNISLEDHCKMFNKQNGLCAICSEPQEKSTIFIDHNHKCCSGRKTCGKCIRELLCDRCNKVLGMCNDSISVFQGCIKYLKKHN